MGWACRAMAVIAPRIIRAAPVVADVVSGGAGLGRVIAATGALSGGVRLAMAVRLASRVCAAGGLVGAAWLLLARRRLGAMGGGVASQIAFRRWSASERWMVVPGFGGRWFRSGGVWPVGSPSPSDSEISPNNSRMSSAMAE